MKILIINSGSSTLKFKLFENTKNFPILAKGLFDKIGNEKCRFTFSTKAKNIGQNLHIKNHQEATKIALDTLLKSGIIKKLSEISAVGHRVVHGGATYTKAVKIDQKVLKAIEKFARFVPLHTPANLACILACKNILERTPQIAVFDTAFHQTMPEKAFLYGIPLKLAEKYGIRRYGFHGTSHKYVIGETIKLLKKKNAKIISCHLGNGSSITASLNGKSLDTSMGFSPLEGVIMGTRSGSIDPAISTFLDHEAGMTPHQVWDLLNEESGLKGLSEISSDMRDIYKESLKGNKKALATIDILSYQIARYCSAYIATLGGLDALVFTAGIGQNAFYVRSKVCEYLSFMGIKLDQKRNQKNETLISDKKSKIKVFVISTDEEKQIALETQKAL